MLLLDQFETVFTDDAIDADRVCGLLQRLLARRDGHIAVIVAVRADFYGHLAADGRLDALLEGGQVVVGPLSDEQLTRAIVEPARGAGGAVDDDLVEVLRNELAPRDTGAGGAHEVGSLPLLSHALRETWLRATGGVLTVAAYREAGGIRGAVEQSAEDVYGNLDTAERAAARQLLLRLVHLDDGGLVARRTATLEELQAPASADADELAPADVLDAFVAARLLTVHEHTVAISHEALLGAWPRLAAWVDEDRDLLRWRRRLGEAARAWEEAGRDRSLVARGAQLEQLLAVAHAAPGRVHVAPAEQAFLDASLAERDRREAARRRATRRLRVLAATTSALALVAAVSATTAMRARDVAETARDEALSRQLALTAQRVGENDPNLAAQLALVGHEVAQTVEARSALLDAAAAPESARYLSGAGPVATAISADGALTVVSDSVEGVVRLLVRDGTRRIEATTIASDDPEADVYALALSPDASLLAIGDTNAQVDLWDVTDPAAPAHVADLPPGPEGPIQDLAFSGDGYEVAAVGLGDGAFRWRVTGDVAGEPLPLLPAEDITWSVTYHPNEPWVAVGDDAGGVTLWDFAATTPRQLARLPSEDGSVLALAFDPTAERLAAGYRSGLVRAWDLADPSAPGPLPMEVDAGTWANTVQFAPNGAHLVVGTSDGTLGAWSTDAWQQVATLPHPAPITMAGFTSDGATLATVATDGAVRWWDFASALPRRLGGAVWNLVHAEDGHRLAGFSGADTGVWAVAGDGLGSRTHVAPPDGVRFTGAGSMSPDGRLLAHGTVDGEIVLYAVADGGEAALLDRPRAAEAQVEMVAFNRDGTLVAAGAADGSVTVLEVADDGTAEPLAAFDTPTEMVLNLNFSPAADVLAAASADGHVYLFDLRDRAEPAPVARLEPFEAEAYGVAFNHAGDLLATSGTDGLLALWDVSDLDDPVRAAPRVSGPSGRVYDLAFSPDDALVAGGVIDGRIWIWDVSDPSTPRDHAALEANGEPTYTVAFAPGGGRLVAAGASGLVRGWDIDIEVVTEALCATVGSPLTEHEWAQFLPDDAPYDPPCR